MAHQDFEKYAYQRNMFGSVSEKYVSFFRENVLPFVKKDFRILDFGCGDGKYFDFFRKFTHESNIFGVEISNIRVERCRQIGWSNVFQITSLNPLPFDDLYFDLVNFDQVIEHIPIQNVPFYLQEIKRVLVGSGLLIIITPNYPIKRFYDLFLAIRKKDLKRIRDDHTHVTKYGFGKLRGLLNNYFRILKLEPTGGFIWETFKYDVFSHKIIGLMEKKN